MIKEQPSLPPTIELVVPSIARRTLKGIHMTKTGRLSQASGDSRIDGILLARKGSGDPFGDATDFLTNHGLGDGDFITVTGESGTIGGTSVIFMDAAVKASESLRKRKAVRTRKKSGSKKTSRATKRAGRRPRK